MIENDEDFTAILTELQELYETVESLRTDISDDAQFDEVSRPIVEKMNLLQENASKYVDDNLIVESDEDDKKI